MENWIFNPNDYSEQDFTLVPVGEHRVRISEVAEKTFRSGNRGYEVVLEVSGFKSKLWFYLVLNRDDIANTNQRIGEFFNCFGITDPNMGNFRAWVGKVGAVRVKHEEYNGAPSAKVAYCISRAKQEKLPPANFSGTAPTVGYAPAPEIRDDELPFA